METDAFREWFHRWQDRFRDHSVFGANMTISDVMREMFADAWNDAFKEGEQSTHWYEVSRKDGYDQGWKDGYAEGYKHGTGASIP